MRTFGLDVHKRFIEVALHEDGRLSRVGRVEMDQLEVFANSLGAEDHVVIESTAVTWAVVDRLSRQAGKVTVSNPMKTKAIASAKVKTDKVDARVLAELGPSGFISEVWVPNAELRALRRRIAQRARLVSHKRRLRNQVHAVLMRNLVEITASDAFGKRGRAELAAAELPRHEREQVEATLRLHDAAERELAVIERSLSQQALASAEVRRLMTIPGVGAITALALLALIGDIARFPTSGHLVGYLGLDPRVRQSGERQARTGRISRQGQAHARGLLVEAALGAARSPGPLRGFNRRIRARRGSQVAAVATARKLAVLIWHLLSKREDYRYAAPMLTRRKLRELEQRAGESEGLTSLSGWAGARKLERELLEQAEGLYTREVAARAST